MVNQEITISIPTLNSLASSHADSQFLNKAFFSTTVANSFYFQLSIIITIISSHYTTCVITPLNSPPLCHNEKTSKQHSCTETSTLPI